MCKRPFSQAFSLVENICTHKHRVRDVNVVMLLFPNHQYVWPSTLTKPVHTKAPYPHEEHIHRISRTNSFNATFLDSIEVRKATFVSLFLERLFLAFRLGLDWVRHSFPFSYLFIDALSTTDGKSHSIQIHSHSYYTRTPTTFFFFLLLSFNFFAVWVTDRQPGTVEYDQHYFQHLP